MWADLVRHPDSQGGEDFRLQVQVSRPRPDQLSLSYRATGDLRLPAPAPSERTDELWRHTCFEAFLQGAAGGYFELNFAPSTQWAAYRLDGYRKGLTATEAVLPLSVSGAVHGGLCEVEALVEVATGADLSVRRPWRLGVSAILEDRAGRISYWALAHAPGKPDFHHPDSFVLELPPPDPA